MTESKKRRQPPKRASYRERVPPPDRYLFGLRDARLDADVTSERLAEMSGVTRQTISRLEWQDHRAKHETVRKLCRALKVRQEVLYGTHSEEELRVP